MSDDSPADKARSRIRAAFSLGKAMAATTLHVEVPPSGASLAVLLRAAHQHSDWRERAASVRDAMNAELDAAGRMIAGLERDVEVLEGVAGHLREGLPLPSDCDGAMLLAARVLAGTEPGLSTARQIKAETQSARRSLDAVRDELRRARSAAAVAQATMTLAYLRSLGLDDSPDATRVRAAWQAAITSHRSLLAEQRGRKHDVTEAAA